MHLTSSKDSNEDRVAGHSGPGEGGRRSQKWGRGGPDGSGLVGHNKDFGLTQSQRQPLESSEQRSNMGPLMFLFLIEFIGVTLVNKIT